MIIFLDHLKQRSLPLILPPQLSFRARRPEVADEESGRGVVKALATTPQIPCRRAARASLGMTKKGAPRDDKMGRFSG